MFDMRMGDTGQSVCRNCGSSVSRRFCRVFGDNQNEIYGCIRCTTIKDLKEGGARPD